MKNYVVQTIAFGSSEYEDTLKLRDRILREPIGLKLSVADCETDAVDLHLGVFQTSPVRKLVACLIMMQLSPETVRMRQVAVDSGLQGQGVGRLMATEFEKRARERGYREIILTARLAATGFYEALGYEYTTEIFEALGVPHRKMRKILT